MPILIKDILKLPFDDSNWKIVLISHWPLIIKGLSSKMVLENVLQNSIVVSVNHPCWMQELSSMSHIIIKEINLYLKNNYIEKIYFKMSSLKKEKKHRLKNNIINYNDYPILKKENDALLKIKDNELKQALKSYLNLCMNNQNLKK